MTAQQPPKAGHTGAAAHRLGPDQATFSGETQRAGVSRETRLKIGFVLVVMVLLLATMAYLRNRFNHAVSTAQTRTQPQQEDPLAQRKIKLFETDDDLPPSKPPIVLPAEAAASLPTLPDSFAALNLPKTLPPPANAANRAMMLSDSPTGPNPGARLAAFGAALNPPGTSTPPADTPAAASALAALLGTANKPGAGTPSASTASGKTTTDAQQTVELQAQQARERNGSQVTGTAQVSAAKLGRRSYVLAKGGFIPCVLETQLISNVFGMTSCVVTQNVYSDDGKMLLIERGSRVTGNYGSNLRNGDSRLAVVWDRIKTPRGITVDVNSPATDGVGAMGMSGVVDKHWFERIAGAIMLSLLQDTLQYVTSSIAYKSYQKEQRDIANTQLPVQMANNSQSQTTTTVVDPETGNTTTTVTTQGQSPVAQGSRSNNSNPPAIPTFGGNNTAKQGASIPEQVLSASINATPTLYKNRGDVVYIFVANDLWFDKVYGLKE